MRILMLAWRDLKNPLKGGAEIVTDAYLSGLAKKGHEIVLFSSSFPGCKEKEAINGYKVVRKGGKLSVYWQGLMYANKNRDDYDYIIDQVNTIPFFTPLLIPKKKRIAFFHQLALNIWFYESPFPVSAIGICLEWLYLKLYFNTRCFVVSESTRNDLRKYALCRKDILVLENQINFRPGPRIIKKEDSFAFCGRLKKSKRVQDCIKALQFVPKAKLYIIGVGNYEERLKRLASKVGVSERVVFCGSLNFKERNKVMAKSLAILVPSVREGWGLIVTEANACGTTAITYDVPGLRDANKTGFVCERNNYKELAFFMNKLLKGKKLVASKSNEAISFARTHADWNKNVDRLERWIKK